jgi:hypothetical protein
MKSHNLKSTDFILDEIESIELIGEGETIDITVEDTHMFFANDIYTHNSAAEAEIIQGHDIADSYIKVMKADFIVSVSRKVEDKIAGTGRWHVIKNRFGPDGVTFPSKINFTNGHIEIFENATVEGKEAQQMMNNGNEYARKYLANKFKEMKEPE